MSDLKPCPFCGRIPVVEDCGTNRWFVRCECGIAQDKLYHQRCDAVKAWNRRKTARPDTTAPTTTPTTDTISRQQAIDALEWKWAGKAAIDAIKSLPSAQPECKRECMPMYADVSDCISRQDAIDAVRTFYADNYALEDSIEELLEKLPSAQQPLIEQLRWERDVAVKQLEDLGYAFGEKPQPQRMKGRWIYREDEETGEADLYAWTCSECGEKYPWQPNFCPNCGAWMSEESETEHTMEEFMYGQDLGGPEDGSL